MEIRRFGVGHRRPEAMPGTIGVSSQVIQADARGVIAELAFGRNARIEPHTNPNATYFVVIEGGGFVQVGDERARVAVGEAIVWPPNVLHGAWTEHSEMRALVVEFAISPPHGGAARRWPSGRAAVAGPRRGRPGRVPGRGPPRAEARHAAGGARLRRGRALVKVGNRAPTAASPSPALTW